MADDNISSYRADGRQDANIDQNDIKLPRSMRKKIAIGHEIFTGADFMHLHLKNKQQSWLERSFNIIFASAEKKGSWESNGRELWEAKGKKLHASIASSPSPSRAESQVHDAQVNASTFSFFHPAKMASSESPAKTSELSKSQQDQLVLQTSLQEGLPILQEIIPQIGIEKLSPAQQNGMAALLNIIKKETEPTSRALLMKVMKHQLAGKIPVSKGEIEAVHAEFQKLDHFRKQVGSTVFIACNWKGLLTAGQKIDDPFIASLKLQLNQAGWSNCLSQILEQNCDHKDKLESFILSLLSEAERKGSEPFNATGEKEHMLISLLAACHQHPDFLNELLPRLDNQDDNWLDQAAAAFLSPTAFIITLTQEIQAKHRETVVNAYKQQFDSSLSPLIDAYLTTKFPNAPLKLSELPAAKELPALLLLYKMGENTHALAANALSSEMQRAAFHAAFAKFLPKDHTHVTSAQLEALDQMAKLASQLIDEHAYDLSEVTKGCQAYFKNLQTRNQQLAAPDSAQTLNAYLLKVLSPIAGWQASLQAAAAAQPPTLVEGLADALESNQLLQPRNLQEIAALAALLAAGAAIHQSEGYPIAAIVKGLTDYLSEQRQRSETFSAPLLMAAAVITPFCYQHLTAMRDWSDKLTDKLPLTAQPFSQIFIQHMHQAQGLVGPINQDELEALEKLVLLGADIANDQNNAYDAESAAAGCVAYLQQMRTARHSFADITSLGGLITHVTKTDLYPLCFAGLTTHLLKGHADQPQITQLLSQTIKGQTLPLKEQGRQRLQALITEMTGADFAQGKGVHHFAAAAKFPSILFDLRLNTVDELNTSSIPSARLHALFNYVQHEQFDLASPSEIFAELSQNSVESAKTVIAGVVTALMGTNHKELDRTILNLNRVIDDLKKKDPAGTHQVVQNQLSKLASQLGLSESADVSLAIDTSVLIGQLRSEAQKIQTPYKNNQEILQLLDATQKKLEKRKTVEEYLELSKKIKLKTEKATHLQELEEDPQVASYLKFLAIKAAATTEKPAEETKILIGDINQLIAQMPTAATVKTSKGRFYPLASQKSAPADIGQSLRTLAEKLALPRTIQEDNLSSCGVTGELVYRGVNALAAMQAERNKETYGNEAGLDEIVKGLKAFEGKFVSQLAKFTITFAPAATEKAIALGIEVGVKLQARRVKKAIKQAEKEGNKQDSEALTVQLNVLKLIADNRNEIAKVATPIASTLLNNHKLYKHGGTIQTLRKILADPNLVLTESDLSMLTGLLAESAETLLAEIEQHYPRLLENLIDTVMNLPKQGKTDGAAAPRAVIPATELKPLSAEQLASASNAAQRFASKLQEEYPLKSEDEAKAAARKKMEEAAAPKAPPAANDWFGSLAQGWNQFAKAAENAVQDISDSAKSTFIDYDRNQAMRHILTPLQSQLASHPFLANNFDEEQMHELAALTKEAAVVQANTGYSADVLATACRLFIESEVNNQGQLDIPVIPRLNEASTAEKLTQYAFKASIEQAIRQSQHPHNNNPHFIQSVVALISQQMVPSQTHLNDTGQQNLAKLVEMMLDPTFAGGKPLDLPVVTTQFKYMFPAEFNTVSALNAAEIPPARLEQFKENSRQQVQRGINLGLLHAGITHHTAEAIALLATPLDNFADDKKTADDMKQAVRSFASNLEGLDQLGWIKGQMETYLEKLGVLKAVQVDVSISTRQATSKLRDEGQALKAFMETKDRIPSAEEAQAIGVVTPLLCNFIAQAAQVKQVLNAGTAYTLQPQDPVRLAAEQLPKASEGLKYAKPFIGLAQGSPLLSNLLGKAVTPVLKMFVLELQANQLREKETRTVEEQQKLALFEFLLKEENIEKMNAVITPIMSAILSRHDFSKYGMLIDQIVKIGDPANQNGVDEVELMRAIVDASEVFFDEVDQYYSELIPDLLNAVKSIQFLE